MVVKIGVAGIEPAFSRLCAWRSHQTSNTPGKAPGGAIGSDASLGTALVDVAATQGVDQAATVGSGAGLGTTLVDVAAAHGVHCVAAVVGQVGVLSHFDGLVLVLRPVFGRLAGPCVRLGVLLPAQSR